ncbi:MAG TPA: 5'/3'-nucleotidase SurE [Aggregatilinea sp.]|uniref:5'/3'-nucleotidase SurE n=1 Tax=Aggregatilinea sp. TaxID=2806333 RepID=UPI002C4DBA8B|nr:5'/3'-nucleotidase SurE [Aggregatilinea sp.]HML24232.1 5'/3'-nucleotidase SurE [Aggregatilinea sp.]
MHILISNDDGVRAPGIAALARAMLPFGKVTVVAPSENQSATGHRKTMHKPLRIDEVQFPVEGVRAYATSDSPSDSVAVALLGFVEEPVDLVVSGINRGPNMGQDLTYSGTVSAAFEAVIWHKPAMAFSLDNFADDADYSAAAAVAQQLVGMEIYRRLPPLTLFNVNVPNLPLDQIKGFKVVRQGLREYNDELIRRTDPYGRPYYWIGGAAPTGDTTQEGTDLWALHEGYVSITPIHLDLTNHSLLLDMQRWGLTKATPGETRDLPVSEAEHPAAKRNGS